MFITKEILNKEIILIDEKIEELLSYKQNIMKRLDTINDELRNLKLYEIDLVYINKRKSRELNANITKDEEFDFHSLMNNEIIFLHMPKYIQDKNFELSEEEYKELDNLANLMLNPNENFSKLQEIWNNTPKFRIMSGALN